MSEVDLARRAVDDAGFVRFLVVKRIRASHLEDDAFVRMFKDEARITSELRHTNIAQVYDFGRVGDEYYLALEYVPGIDLRGVLGTLRNHRRRMPVRMALRIASDTLEALHYAHTRTDTLGRPMEVVHRDVNPRNIMISVSGEVKLIDFGVARATDRLERTQTDHFKGKVAYMAPEQVTGTEELDHRVDIFAMGLTLYEMLSGRGAFAGLDQTQILYRILNGQLPALDVPSEWGGPGRSLKQLVAKAMAPKMTDRFTTARAMRDAVQRVATEFGGLPTPGELAAWLGEVEPGLQGRIRDKMRRLSGELPPEGSEPVKAPEPVAPSEASGTMERPTANLSAPVVVAAGLGTATLVGIVLLTGVVVIGGLLVAVGLSGPGSPAPTVPAELQTETVDAPPETAPEPDKGPATPLEIWPPPYDPYEGKAQRPAGTASGGGASGAAAGSQVPEPDQAGADAVQADPVDQPPEAVEPSTETTPTVEPGPAPATEPTTEPVALGQLQVTAATKGLVIVIDGKPTPHRTGQQFAWPAGRHTVAADGLAPITVEVRPGLMAFVPLKPEAP